MTTRNAPTIQPQLLQEHDGPAVSILLPTSRGGAETRENPIRFKSLVKEAGEALQQQKVADGEAQKLMAPAVELIDRTDFWQHRQEGLAMFLAGGSAVRVDTGWPLPARATVGANYNVRPLVPPNPAVQPFYLLTMNLEAPALWHVINGRATRVEVEDMPSGLSEALMEDPEQSLQYHKPSSPRWRPGQRDPKFHGHGGAADDASSQERAFELCRQVDDAIAPVLREQELPLLLSAVDWIVPVYRKANHYDLLMDEAMIGNFQHLDEAALGRQAADAAAPWFEKPRNEALEVLKQARGSSRYVEGVSDVLKEAKAGKVQTLWLHGDDPVWGRADNGNVKLHDKPEPGDDDLVNLAVLETLRCSGEVFKLRDDDVPKIVPVAAVLRY